MGYGGNTPRRELYLAAYPCRNIYVPIVSLHVGVDELMRYACPHMHKYVHHGGPPACSCYTIVIQHRSGRLWVRSWCRFGVLLSNIQVLAITIPPLLDLELQLEIPRRHLPPSPRRTCPCSGIHLAVSPTLAGRPPTPVPGFAISRGARANVQKNPQKKMMSRKQIDMKK